MEEYSQPEKNSIKTESGVTSPETTTEGDIQTDHKEKLARTPIF